MNLTSPTLIKRTLAFITLSLYGVSNVACAQPVSFQGVYTRDIYDISDENYVRQVRTRLVNCPHLVEASTKSKVDLTHISDADLLALKRVPTLILSPERVLPIFDSEITKLELVIRSSDFEKVLRLFVCKFFCVVEKLCEPICQQISREQPSRRDGFSLVVDGIINIMGLISVLRGEPSAGRPPPATGAAREYFEKEKKIREFKAKIEAILQAATDDPLHKHEICYMLRKPFYPKDVQTMVETLFIAYRDFPAQAQKCVDLLDKLLKLPVFPLPLIYSPTGEKIGEEGVRKRVRESKVISLYNERERTALDSIVREAVQASLRASESNLPNRRAYYLYGPPGCGKTTAAEEVPKLLGVPYQSVTLTNGNELRQENIAGVPGGNIGLLARVLITEVPDPVSNGIKKPSLNTYQNGFLVLNDFDRVAGADFNKSGALPFLIRLLDPKTTTIKVPALGIDLDISRMNIIITANSPIPETEPTRALRDRVEIVPFDKLNIDSLRRIARGIATELAQENRELSVDALIRVIDFSTIDSIRQLREQLIKAVPKARL